MKVQLPYGKGRVTLDVPDGNLMTIVRPNELRPGADAATTIRQALETPLDSERLKAIVEDGDKVVLVVDDYTRACPTARLLPLVLDELGVGKRHITILFANGTHRPVMASEASNILGPSSDLPWVNSVEMDYEYVGTTTRHTEVRLCKKFIDADVRVLLGDVELHYYAGYGGGRKSILPGISSHEAVQNNHKLMFDPNARLGNLQGNPVHLDMVEAYELSNTSFILNVVQNSNHELVGAFAGSHDAFYEGVKLVDSMYKIASDEASDIVIAAANGYPKDINLYQALKAVSSVLDVVKKDGVLILLAECSEGHGNDNFHADMQRYEDSDAVKHDLLEEFVLGRHKVYYMLDALEKVNIILVSAMARVEVENVFRLRYAKDIASALEMAFELAGGDSSVLLSPNASTTMSCLKSCSRH